MAANSSCLFCRKNVPSEDKDCNHDEFSKWRIDCGESLCELLFGSASLSFHQYFQREQYCAHCLQIIRDVDFTLRQLKFLENRKKKLLAKIKRLLIANYNCIAEKTSEGDLKERMSTALAPAVKINPDKYSYDEIVEIIYEAAVKKDRNLWNIPRTIMPVPVNEIKEEDGEVPFAIKMEQGEKEDAVMFDVVTCEYMDDSENHDSSFLCNSNENESNDKPKRQRRAKQQTMSYNETESDEDDNLANEVDESDSHLHLDELSDDESYELEPKSSKLSLKRRSNCSELTDQGKSSNSSSVLVKLSKKSSGRRHKSKSKRKNGGYKRIEPKLRKVKCKICSQMISAVNMAYHIRTHTGEKPFSCEECHKKFTGKDGLSSHMRWTHGKLNPNGKKVKLPTVVATVDNDCVTRKRRFHCELCSWTHNMKYRYLRHLKDEHLNEDVKNGDTFCFHYCDAADCLNSYTSLTSLRKHIFEVHLESDESQSIAECEKCQKSFLHQSNLELHRKCHEDDNFGCKYCNMEIGCEKELEHHLPRHEIVFSESLFCHVCPQCGGGFTDIKMLRKHVADIHDDSRVRKRVKRQKSEKFFCEICQKAVYQKGVESHMSRFHGHPKFSKPKKSEGEKKQSTRNRLSEIVGPKCITPGVDSEMCTICHLHYHKWKMKMHIFSHTRPEGFPCPHCNIKKVSPGQLEAHIMRYHPPDQSNLPEMFRGSEHKCSLCNLDCKQANRCRRHIVRLHPQQYQSTHPHVCQHCWFVFETEEERNSHVKNYHNAYVCSIEGCGKRFTTGARLDSHLNIHNQVKPYICPYCKKGFGQEANCYSHVHMVHTKHRSLRCKLCPENPGYYVKKEFNKHVEKTHGEMPVDQYNSILVYQKPLESLKIEKVSNAMIGS